jgi:hypothetical protein
MTRIIIVLIMIVGVLLAPSVWADSDLGIELAKAKIIVDRDNELKQAKEALKNGELTGDAYDKKLKEVEDLKTSLGMAVKAAWGSLTLEDGIAHARRLQKQNEYIDYLNTKKASEEDVAFAKSDLQKTIVKTSEQDELQKKADERFAGFGFGVAIGVVGKAGKRDVIQSATLDPNGIVRVDDDGNTTANLILESHYFFTPDSRFIPLAFDAAPKNWGHGPFVAVQPGTQNIIESIGAGWMLGFKRSSIVAKDLARDRGDSFNLGLGIMINPNAQVLGDGISKNQVLPTGETAVRLKTTTELGWLFVFSYSF